MITDDDDFSVFSFDELVSPEELSDKEEKLEDIINNPESDFATEIKDKGKEISNYIKQYLNKNTPEKSFDEQEKRKNKKNHFESSEASDITILFSISVQDQIPNRDRCQEINQLIKSKESKDLSRLLSNFRTKGFVMSNEVIKERLVPFKRTLIIDQNNNDRQYIRIQNINGLDILLDLDRKKYIIPRNHKNNPLSDQVNLYFSILAGKNISQRRRIQSIPLKKNCDEVFDRIRRNPI
jgi:hypothetical protein